MIRLPIIVGFGGINAAGRSSHHHAYHRMVLDTLPEELAERTLHALSRLMNLNTALSEAELRHRIEMGTLVRRVQPGYFNVDQVPWSRRIDTGEATRLSYECDMSAVPKQLPPGWQVKDIGSGRAHVLITGIGEFFVPDIYESPVKSGGQLPDGFEPGARYPSRHHPKGLAMAVFGASDAIGSMGIDWDEIKGRVPPNAISVYAGSAMGQLDQNATGGMLAARRAGKPVTPKMCPLGFAQMTADFINAYVLGNLGRTGTSLGACASFLYNLGQAVADIQSGRARVAVVGSSEAPLSAEIIEGYASMGALATDKKLLELDGHPETAEADHRRACRPFSTNCGFVVGESAQFLILFDDTLALELGATIHGAVTDVFINADGHKKSIAAPGVGNYVTFASAVASARALIGDEALRRRSYVHAHGSGTPQNRITESHILDETAKAFGINDWLISAVKCYLGHSIGTAAGDQVIASLGAWSHGFVPGISTIDHVADDVYSKRLRIEATHNEVGTSGMDVAFINAKGFGGNNASTALLAPHVIQRMLQKRHGREAMSRYMERNEAVMQASAGHLEQTLTGTDRPIYRFGENVLDSAHINITADRIHINGDEQVIEFGDHSAYADMI